MRKKVITSTSLLITLLFFSTDLVYSSSALAKTHHRHHAAKHTTVKVAEAKIAPKTSSREVNPKVWSLAYRAYKRALEKGYVKQHILTIIDYSLPSSAKRLWVVDVERGKVLY